MPLALNAAAWFFVGESDGGGSAKNVVIKPPFRIGRCDGQDLVLPNRSVSGYHAEIVEENGELWLRDLNSTNGTFVNGVRITSKTRLVPGDTVQFAAALFQVSCDHDPSSSVAPRAGVNDDALAKMQDTQFDRLFKGGVVPFFQPIVRIDEDARTIVGFEVLGRSRLFGLRTPAQMFAAASRMEMEAELSRALRNQGIEVASNGLAEHLSLFVNTHPAELQCDGLVESLQDIRRSFPNRPITLEIHESALNDTGELGTVQSELKALNINLAFYDFGAGQTRLVELSEITPDVLKFDDALVKQIDKATAKRQKFVASLVKMVKDLGITPLAEFVESVGEHQTLRQLGFELGQGFLYGRPGSLPDFAESSQSNVPSEIEVKTNTEVGDKPGDLQRAAPPSITESKQAVTDESPPSSGPQNANWLLTQPSNHFTIQVLSAISQERAQRYIDTQENPQEFAVFCKQGKTRTLFIVVYGVFEDQAAAKSASGKLATSAVSPWIRRLSGVHAEIRNTAQQGD